jgi:uncharacterized Rmd1/YagE family protein
MSALFTAYAIASTLSVKEVAKILAPRATSQRLTKTQLTVQATENRWIVVYDFGAVVLVGYTEDDRKTILAQILEKTGPEPHPPMQEELLVEIQPASTPQSLLDRIIVPKLDAPTVELAALVVAQSAAMEYYEEDVDTLMNQVQLQMRTVEDSGSFRGGVRSLVKFIGSAANTRNQVASTLSLLETPLIVWEDPRLEGVYVGLRTTFEIEDRYRALEHRLGMVQDNLALLLDLVQQKRSFFLELSIAVMIALEIVLVVYQVLVERR